MLELPWDPKQEIDTKWKWGDSLMNMLALVRSSSYSFLKMWTVYMLASWYHASFGKLVFQWKRFFSVSLVHYSRDLQVQNSATFSLKLGPTAPFTHLKIILLQCFQFCNKQYPNKPICWKISTQHIFLQSHNKGELTLILIWHEETI